MCAVHGVVKQSVGVGHARWEQPSPPPPTRAPKTPTGLCAAQNLTTYVEGGAGPRLRRAEHPQLRWSHADKLGQPRAHLPKGIACRVQRHPAKQTGVWLRVGKKQGDPSTLTHRQQTDTFARPRPAPLDLISDPSPASRKVRCPRGVAGVCENQSKNVANTTTINKKKIT